MSPKKILLLALVVLSVVALPDGITAPADAQATHTLRLATLAPRGSAWERGFSRWDRLLRERTGGRVRLQVYYGGAAGDERTVVRKMRDGQLDAAAVTTTGLGMIVRQVSVLSAPGVIETYPQLDAVRSELGGELAQMFEQEGFVLLGWGDAGAVRLFSKRRILTPQDLRAARVWVWRDNPVFVEMLRSAGINGVPLAVPEVLSVLQTGRIDTLPSSALAAVALQWYSQTRYVSSTASGVVVGAMVIRKDALDALPEDARALVIESSRQNERRMQTAIRQFDERAYRAILERGLTAVDAEAHRPAWEAIGARARARLSGRLYSADLLARVEAIAARHPRRP